MNWQMGRPECWVVRSLSPGWTGNAPERSPGEIGRRVVAQPQSGGWYLPQHRTRMETRLRPWWGDVQLDDISRDAVVEWIDEITAKSATKRL